MQIEKALIVVENSWVPVDRRVWYEATALRDAGWQVTVICPTGKVAQAGKKGPDHAYRSFGEPEDLEGVTVLRFPLIYAEQGVISYLKEYVSAFFCIARLSWKVWRQESFDIIQICNPPDIFFPIGVFYRCLGAKFVFDHHDLFPENVIWLYHGLVGRFMYAVSRLAEYLTFFSANVVMTTNKSYQKIAYERGKVSPDNVVVVRNGPKIDEFIPVDPVPALKLGFPFMVCYAGIMGEGDGILETIEIIRCIVRDLTRHDVYFVLLGDGAKKAQALANIKSWELEAFVDMPGMIRDDMQLRQYMSTADVFISPEPLTPMNTHSTFIKIGEYMAIGKPIVAFDLKETRYTAQNAACYVPPGDIQGFGRAIINLLDDPIRRQQMGNIGRQRILDCLGWEHQKQHLFRAYALAKGKLIP